MSSTLYRLKILERANKRVKVRYIGYSKKYDEWREANDIIDRVRNPKSRIFPLLLKCVGSVKVFLKPP